MPADVTGRIGGQDRDANVLNNEDVIEEPSMTCTVHCTDTHRTVEKVEFVDDSSSGLEACVVLKLLYAMDNPEEYAA